MMLLQPRWMLLVLAVLCLVVMVTAEDKQSEEKSEQKHEIEKRSQEDIMFGNQQNKPAGMVDDLLAFPEGHERKTDAGKTANKTAAKSEKSETKPSSLKQHGKNEDQHFDYYDYSPDNNGNGQDTGYPMEATDNARIPISSRLPDPQLYIPREIPDYPADDFDNALYRRKRTSRRALRKRSLRSNLEDLLGNHHRLPRRAPRLKRDAAGVEQILNWLEMIKQQSEAAQQEENSIGDANDDAQLAYYYYYDFPKQQQALGLPMPVQQENLELPPALLDSLALEAAAEEARNEEPLEFRFNPVNPVRRQPYIYPVDYRYAVIPGQKKRVPSRHMGRWGKFGNRRRYGGDGDDDLFALANMLTDGDDQQAVERRRRRAA